MSNSRSSQMQRGQPSFHAIIANFGGINHAPRAQQLHQPPVMQDTSSHLRLNGKGVLCVGKAHVPLDDLIQAYDAAHSPGDLAEQFPQLSEEEIREGVAYFLHNPDNADRPIPEIGDYWKSHEL